MRTVSRRAWWPIALIVAAGVMAYANSFSGPFVFDDRSSVEENRSIRDLGSPRVFTADREAPTAGRPLVNVSLALNYAYGGLRPTGYHATNLALHLGAALLLFGCIRRTLLLPRMPPVLARQSIGVAVAAALLWTVHPLNSEVVDYITQRTESLMAIAYLTTLYASVRALSSRSPRGWITLSVGACAAGMFCKESMVTAPLVVWMYDRSFVFDSWIEAIRRRWQLYLALAGTWVVLATAIWSGPRSYSAGFSTDVSVATYLVNQAAMLVRYAYLTVWPQPLVVAYGPPLPLHASDVAPQIIVIALFIAAAVTVWSRWSRAGFALVFAIVALAPTSSIVPIATEVGAERRMYLPLAALLTLAVAGAAIAAERLHLSRAVKAGLCAILALALGTGTFARNRDYQSGLVLAEQVLERWPTSFAHALVGVQLAVAGRHDDAIAQLRQAVPEYPVAEYHLGGELFNRGATEEAIGHLQAFIAVRSWMAEAVPARTMIGRAHMLQRQYPAAIEQFRLVRQMTPVGSEGHLTATGFLADSLFAREQFQEAQSLYAEYLALRPGDAGATTNMAIALSALGHVDAAVVAFRRAVELNPLDQQAKRNLAIALSDQANQVSARGRR